MSIVEKILSLVEWAIFLIGSGFALGIGLACAWIVAGLGKNYVEVNSRRKSTCTKPRRWRNEWELKQT